MVQISWNSNILDDTVLEAAMQAGAEHLLDESNRKCPHETGDLIRSGTAKAEGNKAAVGYSSPYATRQHEELGWQHDEGREAKYLENALINHRAAIFDTVADELRARMT